MTAAMTQAELLALLDSDPAAGILAAAQVLEDEAHVEATLRGDDPYWSSDEASRYEKRWTPALALVINRRWRGVVERHAPLGDICCWCGPGIIQQAAWPCPDVIDIVDEAKAYVGGTP